MKNKNLNIILIGLIALSFQLYGLKFYKLADLKMYSVSRVYPFEYVSEPTVFIPMAITIFAIIIAYINGKES